MPVTTKFGIVYPDGTSGYAPLQNWFAAIANSVEAALTTGLGGAPRLANSDSERNTIYPSPVQGNTVVRPDKGWTEQYFALYNAGTNPSGATPAGWYPVTSGPSAYGFLASGILTTGAETTLAFTSTRVFGGFTVASNAFTVPITGEYRMGVNLNFTQAGGITYITKNGVAAANRIYRSSALGGSKVMRLTAGDVIYLRWSVPTGYVTNDNDNLDTNSTVFALDYVSPPRAA